MNFRRILSPIPLEALIWFTALCWFAMSEPGAGSSRTLCLFRNLGIENCPGCGLGSSVSYALHGQFYSSLHAHILGMPAVLILLSRIGSLLKGYLSKFSWRTSSQTKESVWPTSCS